MVQSDLHGSREGITIRVLSEDPLLQWDKFNQDAGWPRKAAGD